MSLSYPFVWSPSGSVYPAGPNLWNGQPVALQPPGLWFTPNVPVDPEEVNWLFGTVTGQQVAAQAFSLSAAALNWCPEFNATGIVTATLPIGAIAWNPALSLWVVAQNNHAGSPGVAVYVSYGLDGGTSSTWTEIGSGVTPGNNWYSVAVCYNPAASGKYFVGGVDSANTIALYNWNLASWILAYSTGAYTAYKMQLAVAGAAVFMAITTNTSGDNNLISSVDQFATQHTQSMSVAFAPGDDILLKSNGTTVLAIPRKTSSYTVWYTSTGGAIWNSSASLAGILAAGNTVVGLAWGADANGPCWLAAVQSGSGQPFWCRSSDGITWSAQAGGVSTNMVVTDMAAGQGGLFVCTLADASSGGPSGQIFSVDGGVTWYFSQATFTSSQAGGNGYITPRIVGSGTGFLAVNNLWARFSMLAGLPAAKL